MVILALEKKVCGIELIVKSRQFITTFQNLEGSVADEVPYFLSKTFLQML